MDDSQKDWLKDDEPRPCPHCGQTVTASTLCPCELKNCYHCRFKPNCQTFYNGVQNLIDAFIENENAGRLKFYPDDQPEPAENHRHNQRIADLKHAIAQNCIYYTKRET